jgi:hypothetical protein
LTGFPLARLVVVFCLACGTVLDAALGRQRGKQTGENALLRTLAESLEADDVLFADRYFGGWFDLAWWQQRRVDVVTRLHQLRRGDFRRGRRLGPNDHVVAWPKPTRPDWMDAATYASLPDALELRELRVRVRQKGFRTQVFVVVTTLRDAATYTAADLADLYRLRWHAEVNLRHLKQTLGQEVLRCQTFEGVLKELLMFVVVYNLVRRVMVEAGRRQGVETNRISFVDALRWLQQAPPGTPLPRLKVNPERPGRVEPRVRKRRPKQYDLMNRPRAVLRQRPQKKGSLGKRLRLNLMAFRTYILLEIA